MKKQPRAVTREGSPSAALGSEDHRARKVQIPVLRRGRSAMDRIDAPEGADDTQRAIIDRLNEIIDNYNEGDD
jgi:hypothetical protein